jgi:5-oxoprolinase (ATP-hydrolysing)
MQVGILSERRSFRPYGLKGGGQGKRGKNFLVQEGQLINIGGKNLSDVGAGDRIIICTPGGGGFGLVD